MKLFRGLSRSDYQDVLRAVGHFIDDHGYTDIRLIETEQGLVLQGRVHERKGIGESSYDTYILTEDDIKELVRAAYDRRRPRGGPAPQ